MADYIVATASTADLPREFLEEHDVPFISYTYIMNEELYEDDCREETKNEVYKKMRSGVGLTTSMINTYSYIEFFEKLMDTGKDVIFLDMSQKLSTSYISAAEATEHIHQKYPNQRFYNVDTRCVSGGLGLLVFKVIELRDAGKSFDETIEWIEANKLKIIHRFTVDDLEYLKRGGRVSNAAALIGSMLSIKPVLYVPDDGSLTVGSKARGRKIALNRILESMKKDLVEPDGQTILINHADCLSDAEFMKAKVLEMFPTVKEVKICGLGVIIGAHCGPGLFTIFYMGSDRHA
ncbi:MAG: DegV family protein [Clostridia bacterium]|nr:DegV family protein [Clostridia bacterium]MBQ4249782.1 DegV family protein [Clostridia bacterium]